MTSSLHQFEGKYEILAKIGEGGMGAVYRVRHRLLDEVRVIKVMRPQVEDRDEVKNRFLREARIAVKVRHPNIAQMYDFSVDDTGTAFIVMEYIDGVTLQTALKRSGPPSLGLTLEIAHQSLQALAHVHKKGIVHRDISPDNLMLTVDDVGEPRIKLIDLGIAKTVKGEHNLTATGVFLGKIRYASPEQFRPQDGATVDHRADLYSFGVVLYELLTGQHPIRGESWSQLIAGHLFEPPLSFDVSDPDGRVPAALREIVATALAKPAADRFQDAKAFRQALVPLRREFPADVSEVMAIVADRGEGHEQPVRPGSTQDRINRQFGDAGPARDAVDQGAAPTAATPAPATTPAEGRLDALVSAAARLVDLELYTEARTQLEAALKVDPDHDRAHQLLARIERAEKRAREVSEAVSRIERLIEAGRLEDAAEHVRTAIGRVGEVSELAVVRERVEHLIGERRAAEVGRLLESADAAESDGRLRDAIEALERAVELAPERSTLAARLEAARAEAERADRIASLLVAADAAESDGRHDDAVSSLEEAARIAPERGTVRTRLDAARIAAAREADVAAAIVEVEDLVGAGRLPEAGRALSGARTRLGPDDRLEALERRITELAAAQRRAAIAEATARGQRLLDDGDLDGAERAFATALDLDPEHSDARVALERVTEARHERRVREARERALAEADRAVRDALDEGDLSSADARLAAAVDELGDAPQLGALRERIDIASRAEAERRQREAAEAARREAQQRAQAEREEAARREARERAERQQEETARREAAERARRERHEKARTDAVTTVSGEDEAREIATQRIDTTRVHPEAPSPGRVVTDEGVRRRGVGRGVWIGVAAIVLMVVALLLRSWWAGEAETPPAVGVTTGTLVIGAAPWAEVVAIVNADGAELPLPDDSVSPCVVELPSGEYTVRLRGPDGGAPTEHAASITAGETLRLAPVLAGPDADALLARYGL